MHFLCPFSIPKIFYSNSILFNCILIIYSAQNAETDSLPRKGEMYGMVLDLIIIALFIISPEKEDRREIQRKRET